MEFIFMSQEEQKTNLIEIFFNILFLLFKYIKHESCDIPHHIEGESS